MSVSHQPNQAVINYTTKSNITGMNDTINTNKCINQSNLLNIASSKQQLAINFTVHKNIVIHLHKINFTKLN